MPEESTTPGLEEVARRSLMAASRRHFDAALGMYRPDAA
jgi:hypothetical protein